MKFQCEQTNKQKIEQNDALISSVYTKIEVRRQPSVEKTKLLYIEKKTFANKKKLFNQKQQ